jgi:hypothetical protein
VQAVRPGLTRRTACNGHGNCNKSVTVWRGRGGAVTLSGYNVSACGAPFAPVE